MVTAKPDSNGPQPLRHINPICGMNRHVELRLILIAAALALAPAVPAHSQCLLCATGADGSNKGGGQSSSDEPLRIEIAAQLDFSRVATGTGGGSVTVDPHTGARRITGNLLDLGGMAVSGEAIVTGTPGRNVRIFIPPQIDLEGDQGRSARVVDVATDLGPAPRIGPDGRLRFRFGGRLQVASDDDGNYRGRIPISAEYE